LVLITPSSVCRVDIFNLSVIVVKQSCRHGHDPLNFILAKRPASQNLLFLLFLLRRKGKKSISCQKHIILHRKFLSRSLFLDYGHCYMFLSSCILYMFRFMIGVPYHWDGGGGSGRRLFVVYHLPSFSTIWNNIYYFGVMSWCDRFYQETVILFMKIKVTEYIDKGESGSIKDTARRKEKTIIASLRHVSLENHTSLRVFYL
jgi:hypothetical protein